MEPLRVLFVHNHYRWRGGEDVVFEAEAEALLEHGHSVDRLVFDNADLSDGWRSAVGTAARAIWSRAAASEAGLALNEFKPDVMHLHNTFPQISPSVAVEARARDIPVVMTLHNYRLACIRADLHRAGATCFDCLESGHPLAGIRHACYRNSRPASAAAAMALEAHALLRTWERSVNLFITPSRLTARLMRRRLRACSIVVKPHFMATDPGPGPGGDFALYVGRLSTEKGIELVLKAWRTGTDLPPLVVVGDGPLRELVEGDQKPESVEWRGELSRAAVTELMGRAAVLVSGSRCPETFGLVVIEAFSRATPVVVPAGTALAELVPDGTAGSVYRSGDATALARGIKEVINRGSRARSAARRTFERHYTPTKGYDGLIDVYRRVIGA